MIGSGNDIHLMDDAVYREELRKRLAKARKAMRKPQSRSASLGTAFISILLMMGIAAILLHHYGILDLNTMGLP
jgi:hypothetical protein